VDEQVRTNLIRVLDKSINALKQNDMKILKEISNETVHDATVFQDEYSITVAVLIYSLSKVFERELHYSQFRGWSDFCSECLGTLEVAKQKLIKGDIEGFDSFLKKYLTVLNRTHKKLQLYIQDVLDKAKINKASRLYEHGLSMGRTAELLGITKFELMDYVGRTYIADAKTSVTLSATERLRFTRGLFK